MPSKSIEVKILPRRFELIKRMYISDKVIAANKRDLIFNWFFEQFGNFKNKTSYTHELLWKTFYEILLLEKNQDSRHRILIKSNAVMNLVNAVTDFPFSNSWSSVILSSVSVLLQTPTVNATLIADVEKLVLLLVGFLKIICKIKVDSIDDVASQKEAVNLANIVLDILGNLSASNDDQKASLLAYYLKDLAVFVHIASDGDDKEMHQISEKLAKKIISVIFNLKEKTFETLLTPPEKSTVVERPNPNILQFFTTLQKQLMSDNVMHYSVSLSTASGTLIGKLLSTFVNQNKSSLNSLKIVSILFAIAGLDIPIVTGATSCCRSLFKENISSLDLSIPAVSHLLEACSTVSRYFTTVAVPDGYIKPSLWLKGVSVTLLDMKVSKSKASLLKCFTYLVTISPAIIDDDILQLIKVAMLNISVHSKESKKQYCELFSIVLQTHSKLHQVPKFFVKLLLALTECIKEDSGGSLLKNGQILPQALESTAKCVQELPYGHMIELWKIFIETFSTLENMSHAFMVSKGFILFVAQLFTTFLLHAQLFQANIPFNINSQFSSLIDSTCDEIKKNISALKDKDYKIVPLKSSVLLLCYAAGEVKFLYNANHGKLPSTAKLPLSDEVFDFAIIHSYLDQNYSSTLETFMKSDEKILSYLVFQLMLQKIRVLDFCSKISDSPDQPHYTNLLQKMIPVILQYLQDSSTASESWDLDLCTINSRNYGSAFWMSFLKISRLVLNHLQPKDVYYFCYSAQDIILRDESEGGAKSFILSSMKNGDFEDFKHFQTAFVSSIWRQNNLLHTKKRLHDDADIEETSIDRIFALLNGFKRKSLKYAQRTPKSDKNLGSMWSGIKEIAEYLNNILLSESLPKDKIITKNVAEVIKLMTTLPLPYLLPGNQMKSIMGLSLLFFLIPQSCSADEAIVLSKEISKLLLIIFDGARSIWLFDFVMSGPYLKFIVKTIESVLDSKVDDNDDWAVQLLEHLIMLAVKRDESLNSLEHFISEIASKNKCSKSVLIILCALMKKLSQALSHPHKQEKYQEALIKVSSTTLQSFTAQMKKNFNDNVILKNTHHYYYIKCYVQAIEMICSYIDVGKVSKECFELLPIVFTKAFDIASSSNVYSVCDVYLLFISKICKFSSKLKDFLPQDFIDLLWQMIFSHFEERRKTKIEFFKTNQDLNNSSQNSSADFKNNCCVFCSCYLDNMQNIKNSQNFNNNISTDKSFLPCSLSEYEKQSLKELSVVTTSEILNEIFLNLLKEMDCFNSGSKDLFSLQFSILICRCLIDANIEKCAQPLLSSVIQKLLSELQYIINQACGSLICHTMVIIPILDFIDFMVKENKGLSKQVLLQNLHCVVPVPLEVCDENYNLFISSFDAVWKVVYDLFMHHTSAILTSTAPFLNCVAKLLKSLVKAGSSTSASKCDTKTLQRLHLCGQNMDRLLTVIARHENEFSKLVPYLIADYVDAVQYITLETDLKESLLSGIHRLLDICSEKSLKMLAVNINYVCREIYTNLVRNYRQTKQRIS